MICWCTSKLVGHSKKERMMLQGSLLILSICSNLNLLPAMRLAEFKGFR